MTDKTNDISSYVKGHLREIKKEEEKTVKLFKELNQRVRVVAKTIGEKYNLKKIYLFGSLLDINSFHLKSDIDLGVMGIESKKYLDLWGEFERKLEHAFDLVNMDKCEQRLKNHIKNEGEIIYDSQKKKS